jgi:hypothetical protein
MFGVDPYDRQRRLLEVGDEGQARLLSAHARIPASDSALLEVAYLSRAGVGRVSVGGRGSAEPFAHADAFHSEATRSVAASAWRALAFIRAALGIQQ